MNYVTLRTFHATQRVGMLLGPQVEEEWFNTSYLSGPFETDEWY